MTIDTPFQKAANWIQGLKLPQWLSDILRKIQELLIEITLDIGKLTFELVKAKIVEVNALPITNEEKFKKVFDYVKLELVVSIKDSTLRLLIECIVSLLKKDKTI